MIPTLEITDDYKKRVLIPLSYIEYISFEGPQTDGNPITHDWSMYISMPHHRIQLRFKTEHSGLLALISASERFGGEYTHALVKETKSC